MRFDFRMALAQDEELAMLFWAGLEDRWALGAADQRRFDNLMAALMHLFEQGQAFHVDGVAHGGQWEGLLGRFVWLARSPGFCDCWTQWSGTRNPVLQREVERIIHAQHAQP